MKSYIITTSFANNYGALLQAYALRCFVSKVTNDDCAIIDYWPKDSEDVWNIYYRNIDFRTIVRNIFVFLDFKYRKSFRRRKELIFKFRKEHLNLTHQKYHTQNEILKDAMFYINSNFICGSDQIWNTTSYWKDPVYFLDFVSLLKGSKAIAYAPSITDKWLDKDKNELKGYLEKFEALSVREKSDVKQVRELTDKSVCHVIDPVFLLEPKEWESFSSNGIKLDFEYILCYFLGTSQNAVSLVNKLKEKTGLKVVHLNINYHDAFHSDEVIIEASPIDFVSLVKGAKYVVSNSFHCSAFSVIFKKNYFVIPKNHANSRMGSLQEMCNINNRIFDNNRIAELSDQDLIIDYSKTDSAIEVIRNKSMIYLENYLI